MEGRGVELRGERGVERGEGVERGGRECRGAANATQGVSSAFSVCAPLCSVLMCKRAGQATEREQWSAMQMHAMRCTLLKRKCICRSCAHGA